MADIVRADTPGVLDEAVRLLHAGRLVCYPTDTVYGLGASVRNEMAVRNLYAVKGRPLNKPMPILIADSKDALGIGHIPPIGHQLMGAFWPGALTIVMSKEDGFHSLALGGGDKVALRVPDSDLVRIIIRSLGQPITGTSANRAGARTPVSAAEAAFQLGDMVALVIDAGPSRHREESTVIDLSEGAPLILREGAVSREDIERVLGKPVK